MATYNFKKIEKKWTEKWEKSKIYQAKFPSKKKKWYSLFEFPYPSGDGLHVGHLRPYIGMDVISRKRRMEGYNVLFPIGWDAFGLPTENYAIKTGIAPDVATEKNTDNFRRQIKSVGPSLDWSREINTTDPNYYKWTQWLFLKFFEKGLAYKANMPVNWCPKDKTGLANEEVVNGKCERCGTAVEERNKEQWMLKITAYADKLLKGLDGLDFLPEIKAQQENWIGRSEGALIPFEVKCQGSSVKCPPVEVFTTRPDTLFGATYLVLAPEHLLLENSQLPIANRKEVSDYVSTSKAKSNIERLEDREKTGIEIKGIKTINPANGEEIPIFVADYVLNSYGTGAIMAVPAHDERDNAFAKKFNLQSKIVIDDKDKLINSGQFNGMESGEAKKKITEFVHGKTAVKYKLRDWVFSRQRYWGEPIPLIHCEKDGWVPVPEKDLPVELPKVEKYQPTDTGESPLSKVEKWVNTKCPKCKGKARRETDTMPNWAGSSWYFLRYIDPENNKSFADMKKLKYWMPVDWYNGGMEHVTLHLLYSRFWNQFLYDEGLVPSAEPYKKRTAHGMILGEGGIKMSKSKGNVVNPDKVIEVYGADALRTYEMFIGPFNQAIAWDTNGIEGVSRFLYRVWNIGESGNISDKAKSDVLEQAINRTIKKVGEDIESMAFNTAVSSMMIFLNAVEKEGAVPKTVWEKFLMILAPFAPFITEELWEKLGNNPVKSGKPNHGARKSIHIEKWPEFDANKLVGETFELIVQVNGKMRGKIEAPTGIRETDAKKLALADKNVAAHITGQIKKTIFVPGRLINFVV